MPGPRAPSLLIAKYVSDLALDLAGDRKRKRENFDLCFCYVFIGGLQT
jgi:hypothetical protein